MPPVNPWVVLLGLLGAAVAVGRVYGSFDQRVRQLERDAKAAKEAQAKADAEIATLKEGQAEVLSKLEGVQDLLREIRKNMGK